MPEARVRQMGRTKYLPKEQKKRKHRDQGFVYE